MMMVVVVMVLVLVMMIENIYNCTTSLLCVSQKAVCLRKLRVSESCLSQKSVCLRKLCINPIIHEDCSHFSLAKRGSSDEVHLVCRNFLTVCEYQQALLNQPQFSLNILNALSSNSFKHIYIKNIFVSRFPFLNN